jgi:iron complex transport system permease protein
VEAAILVGASLAAAGAAFQGMFRNPLASPDLLGVSAGASLGAVLGIFLGLPVAAVQGLAFAGGIAAVAAVAALSSAVRGQGDPVLVLILAGIALGALMGAAISLLKILADPYNQLPAITFWLLGTLSAATREDILAAAPAALLGLVVLLLLRWRLNLLTLGEDEARALGVNTTALRAFAVAGATLATAPPLCTRNPKVTTAPPKVLVCALAESIATFPPVQLLVSIPAIAAGCTAVAPAAAPINTALLMVMLSEPSRYRPAPKPA